MLTTMKKFRSSVVPSAATMAFAAVMMMAPAAVAQTLESSLPFAAKFQKQVAEAGRYKVTTLHGGKYVMIHNVSGKGVAFVGTPVRETVASEQSSLRFERTAQGEYEFAGYCIANRGCWSRSGSVTQSSSVIEVAMK